MICDARGYSLFPLVNVCVRSDKSKSFFKHISQLKLRLCWVLILSSTSSYSFFFSFLFFYFQIMTIKSSVTLKGRLKTTTMWTTTSTLKYKDILLFLISIIICFLWHIISYHYFSPLQISKNMLYLYLAGLCKFR